MKRRRPKPKGRYWVAFWMVVFLAITSVVVARQKSAFAIAGRLRKLKEERGALQAREAEVERRIRLGSTAETLLTKMQRIGVGLASDTSSTILVVGADQESGKGGH